MLLDDEQKVLNVAKAVKLHRQAASHEQSMLAHLHFRHPRTVELLQQSTLCQNQDHQVQWRFFNIHKKWLQTIHATVGTRFTRPIITAQYRS